MANEGEGSTRFVIEVLRQCEGFRAVRFFVVLDQATTDNSLVLLQTLEKTEPRLKVVWAPENLCVVDAYVRGYREALAWRADWILEIDAGFSHQPGDIPKFFDVMRKGYACVFGSRFMRGGHFRGSFKRYVVSRGGTAVTNLLIGTKQTDMTSGFELFSRAALEEVLRRGVRSRAHFFQTEIKVYCRRLRMMEVPIDYRSPSPRMGRFAIADSLHQLWRLFRLRCSRRL
jgi:dolichol-phosphate mannosyltransferase